MKLNFKKLKSNCINNCFFLSGCSNNSSTFEDDVEYKDIKMNGVMEHLQQAKCVCHTNFIQIIKDEKLHI